MNDMVTLSDISLSSIDLSELPLIHRLRRHHFNAPTEVCIERAKLITEYLKTHDENEPGEIRRAKAVAYYMANREPLILDDNLLAGSTTSKSIGAPVYPELLGLTIWPELETISSRQSNPQLLTPEEANTLNLEVFPYWMDRTAMEAARHKFNNPQSLRLMERMVFFIGGKAGTISHCVPSYEIALHHGLNSMIEESEQKERMLKNGTSPNDPDVVKKIVFYQALQIALKGIIAYAANLSKRAEILADQESNPWRKRNLRTLSRICAKVPAHPATTYLEAVNSLWLCQVGILAENVNMAMSPGRMDKVLYPFYKRDVEDNGLTLEKALNISCCLWLKIADNTNLVPETAEKLFGGAGSTPAVTLGGIDENGNDAVSDLTYIFLRTSELMRLRDPNVNARYHYGVNDKDYRRRVCEVILNTRAIPAFHNDVVDIETLKSQGIREDHARDFAIVGCVELASTGRDYVASSSILLNLAAAMEMTLFSGKRVVTGEEQIGPQTGDPATFASYAEFWEAFKTQLKWLIEQAIDFNERLAVIHQETLPTPMLSAFFEGCMERGKDLIQGGALYNSSGATHVAFPDVCDSLNAIEFAVFQEKKLSMAQMIEAVRTDFSPPFDKYVHYLKNRTPKFGENHPIAVKNSQTLVKFIFDTYQSHTNYRGGSYRPAYWSMTNHAGQGRICGALPSGRRAHQVFSSGITPVSQAAKHLVTAFNSVAALPGECIPGGEALNIKYTPLMQGEDRERYLEDFGDLVEAYFRKGGLQVQFNIQDYETFIEAKAHPENYPEMIVRVSGYSAYFKDLSEPMKDELITRTQYDLGSKAAVPLPDAWKEGD